MAHSHSSPTRPATLVEGLELHAAGVALHAGQRLGPYRLLKALGEGGMGVVWLADQLEPFERKVAIKLSNQKIGSGLAQSYFEVERQAMATMVHPYIAQIYDAGALPNGALYFAMEYVQGGTLDSYVSTNKPSLDACAALLALVCQGVQYAHQRGLIHRDLKPANILIADVAGQPMPKIIDFGIAIGVDSARAAAAGSAGTRAYMAPEQLNPNADGIDVRADVYALGAILVETLCLALDISLEPLAQNSLRSLLSAAAYTTDGSRDRLQNTPALRTQIKRIPKPLRAIALKAMADDRAQRYESAAAFADDLSRWRERRPVLAMRGGRIYAVQCFVNRYRAASTLGFLTLVSLIAGLVVAAYGLNQAQHARALAETRREQAEKLVGYMLGDFATKLDADGKLDLIHGVAKQALAYLSQANDPDAHSAIQRAAALRTIGDLQTRRGQWDEAKVTFTKAEAALNFAESAKPGTAELLFERAQVAYWIGYCAYNARKFDAAKVQWQRYLEYAQRLQPLTVAEGTGLLETSYAFNNLGIAAFGAGELGLSIRYFDQVIETQRKLLLSSPKDSSFLSSLSASFSWRAKAQEANGDLTGALFSYRNQLSLIEQLRASSPNAANLQFNEANARQWISLLTLQLGNMNEAKDQLVRAITLLASLHSLDPSVGNWQRTLATAESNLAWLNFAQGNEIDSEIGIERAIDLFLSETGSATLSADGRRGVAIAYQRAAVFEFKMGRNESGEKFRQKAIDLLEALLASDSDDRKSTVVLICAWLGAPNPQGAPLLRAKTMLLHLAAKQPDAEVLAVLVRVHILLHEFSAAHKLQSRLDAMGYQHPNYRAFLAIHSEGAKS